MPQVYVNYRFKIGKEQNLPIYFQPYQELLESVESAQINIGPAICSIFFPPHLPRLNKKGYYCLSGLAH